MIVLAYDHRAFELMKGIKEYLNNIKQEFIEFANKEYDKNDSYSMFAKQANKYILEHNDCFGIYSCRSGIGVDMAANRAVGIRAGLCVNKEFARLGRNDDNINVLVLPAGFLSLDEAIEIINVFLNTEFEGGRHIKRLEELDK